MKISDIILDILIYINEQAFLCSIFLTTQLNFFMILFFDNVVLNTPSIIPTLVSFQYFGHGRKEAFKALGCSALLTLPMNSCNFFPQSCFKYFSKCHILCNYVIRKCKICYLIFEKPRLY